MTPHAGDKRRSAPGKLAAPVLAAAMALSACGQEEEPRGIPSRDAQYLIAQLDEAERRVQNRACVDAREGNLFRIERNVANLPDDVNGNVRDALSESVDNLGALIEEKCRERPEPEPEPEPDPTPTETTPAPTTPDPGPTTTEEEPTETQEEPEPDPDEGKDPPSNGGGGGGGDGGGNDKGGGGGGGNGGGGAGAGGGNNGGAGAGDDAGATVIPGADR